MHTGAGDISQLGRIETWNRRPSTEAYSGKCGEVQGSADGLFPPGTAFQEETIDFWSTDLCRFVQLLRDFIFIYSSSDPCNSHVVPA